ncbi:hypothetical protein AVEN_41907-1 [Araneus ventricosus]|uniref:Uncharacterized protein n=1 Tax=Araneus ventricosus TaxID=182803 RepID=A0A4Y2ACW8_ARAVE|nr:hypothetical protein AVEN_41907-1 [Araneus ventricosus]
MFDKNSVDQLPKVFGYSEYLRSVPHFCEIEKSRFAKTTHACGSPSLTSQQQKDSDLPGVIKRTVPCSPSPRAPKDPGSTLRACFSEEASTSEGFPSLASLHTDTSLDV